MKKRVVSLLLCLIMALSLIPTVAFADDVEVQKPTQPGTGIVEASHIDVRVNAKLKIDRQSNGQSQSGYPKEVNVTVTNVTGTKNGDTIHFQRKLGSGTEDEWRATGHYRSDQTIILTCTLKLSDSDETFIYTHTYTSQELKIAKNTCPKKQGFDINIYAEDIQDTITKTVKFFTADKDMGLLNTTEESVTHANLVVNSEFPARPTTDAKTDYEFDGWYEANASGNKTGTTPITNFPEKVTADAYYVAVWKTAAPTKGTLTVTKNIEGLPFAKVPVKAFEYFANLAPDYAAAPSLFTLTVAETATGITATNSTQLDAGGYSLTESSYNADVAGYKCVTTFAINGEIKDRWDHSDPTDGPDGWPDFNIAAGETTNIVITDTYTPNTGDTGTLTITKAVTGLTVQDLPKEISFTVKGPNNYSETVKFVATDFDTTTLVATKQIKNLPVGAYTVTEDKASAQVDGYTLTNVATDFEKVANVTENGGSASFTNTYVKHTTAKITIVKNVDVTGNTQPTTMPTFQFVAKVSDQKVGELFLKPVKDANGKWTISGVMDITIPVTLFNGKDNVDVKISEVKGNLAYWTYDGTEYTLTIAQNGEIVPPVSTNSTGATATVYSFTNKYTYTYTPPTRPTNPIRRQPTTTTKPVQSVKTGDMGIALYAVTSLLSLSGTALVIKKRKDEK